MEMLLRSWEVNCAANDQTNGQDLRTIIGTNARRATPKRARASIIDASQKNAVGLPGPFLPTAPPVDGSGGVIKSFILPDNITGVVSRRYLYFLPDED